MYDLIILGCGPAGYSCATHASKLGGRVLLLEKGHIGGVCTNVGCIPTKSLWSIAKLIRKNKSFGIKHAISFEEAMKKANSVARSLSQGMTYLLNAHKIEVLQKEGRVLGPGQVEVEGQLYDTKSIVLATGSEPYFPQFADPHNHHVTSSKDIWKLNALPSSIIIIGAGVEGVEFANIFNQFGSKVTLLEKEPRILPNEEVEVSSFIERTLREDGIEIILGKRVLKISGNSVILDGKTLEAERILITMGRKINVENYNLIGIDADLGGVRINDRCETNIKGIYAIGDVTGSGLAHVAIAQGEVAAYNAMGHNKIFDPKSIPRCIFTNPEIAFVGIPEKDSIIKKFPFAANGMAAAISEPDGFVKVYIKDKKIVGACILGEGATELIGEIALAVKNQLTAEAISTTIHAHPSLGEAFQEAVRAATTGSIYIMGD